ncbi:MAG: hypothetical protein HYR62_06015 [Actinobacteria bacterium]|nr:hypothetical protein [Actinomycetota bacterium]
MDSAGADQGWMVSLVWNGAMALVGAAATDAWQTARAGFVALFRRYGDRRANLVATQLDADAWSVEQAAPPERDQVRRQLLPAWHTRLADLLAEHADDPDGAVARELRTFTESVEALLPTSQQTWIQHVDASAPGAIAQGVQSGNIHNYYGDMSCDPVVPAPTGGDTVDGR